MTNKNNDMLKRKYKYGEEFWIETEKTNHWKKWLIEKIVSLS